MRSDRTNSADQGVDLALPKNRLVKKFRRRKKFTAPSSLMTNPLVSMEMVTQLFSPPPPAEDEVIYIGTPDVQPVESAENVRTVYMKRFFKTDVDGYDETSQTLNINGVEHKVITSELTDFSQSIMPLASCGSSRMREIIILDRQNSPLLMQIYANYRSALNKLIRFSVDGKIDAKSLIAFTNIFMRQNVFDINFNMINECDALIFHCKMNPAITKIQMRDSFTFIPCIPIDVFLEAKKGVCRHHALVSAYLLDRFIQGHPKRCNFVGKVQIMRDNVGDMLAVGAHAWVTLVCKEGDQNATYSLDSLNNLVGRLEDAHFARLFGQSFGHHTTKNQTRKAELLRSHVPGLM